MIERRYENEEFQIFAILILLGDDGRNEPSAFYIIPYKVTGR